MYVEGGAFLEVYILVRYSAVDTREFREVQVLERYNLGTGLGESRIIFDSRIMRNEQWTQASCMIPRVLPSIYLLDWCVT